MMIRECVEQRDSEMRIGRRTGSSCPRSESARETPQPRSTQRSWRPAPPRAQCPRVGPKRDLQVDGATIVKGSFPCAFEAAAQGACGQVRVTSDALKLEQLVLAVLLKPVPRG
jgi:hypothetical protein